MTRQPLEWWEVIIMVVSAAAILAVASVGYWWGP
jgi:hypothetical protein